jgi:hypothetical protein
MSRGYVDERSSWRDEAFKLSRHGDPNQRISAAKERPPIELTRSDRGAAFAARGPITQGPTGTSRPTFSWCEGVEFSGVGPCRRLDRNLGDGRFCRDSGYRRPLARTTAHV